MVRFFLRPASWPLAGEAPMLEGTNSSTGPGVRWHPERKAAAARGPGPWPERMAGVIGPGPPAWSTSTLGTRSSGRCGRGPAAKRGAGSRRGRRRRTSRPGARDPASRTGPLVSRDHDDGCGVGGSRGTEGMTSVPNGRSGQLRRYPNLLIRRRPALPEDAHRGTVRPSREWGRGTQPARHY